MTPESALTAAVFLPLLGALVISTLGQWPNLRECVTLLVAGGLLAVVSTLVGPVISGERPEVDLITAIEGLPIGFKAEPLGMLYALVASTLWIATSVYAIGYMRGHGESNQTRFYTCFAIAIAAAQGIALARNVFTLFLFYEVLTFSTYPLVTHHGDEKARRAGRVYLGILLTTSIGFLLLATIWTWQLAGTLEFTPGGILAGHASPTLVGVLLGLFAFGSGKAALMPLHRWLPAAMVAPTPVSALLHAVAVVKAGVFTITKIVVYVFGLDLLRDTGANIWLGYVAAFTLLTASLVAMTKDNLKERLAYSTISQLAYVVLGAALANVWSVIGAAMHVAMHAMGKITLFFCAGAIYVKTHKTQVSQLDGLGRQMPLTMLAFGVGAVSVIGLPPLGGAWSKWFLALGAAESHHLVLLAALMISSLLNIAYLMPIAIRAFFVPVPSTAGIEPAADGAEGGETAAGDGAEGETRAMATGWQEAPWLCVLPLCATAIGCVVLFFGADVIYELLLPMFPGEGALP